MVEKSKAQEYIEARKLHDAATSKKIVTQEDDDDGSGGGNGKQMQGSFKLGKLLDRLAKHREQVKNFFRFLNKEGLDGNELKKTKLGKQKEKAVKVKANTERAQQVNQNQDWAKEIQKNGKAEGKTSGTQREKSTAKTNRGVWEKAKATSTREGQRFTFQNSESDAAGASPSNENQEKVSEHSRNLILDKVLPGTIRGANINHHGFIKPATENNNKSLKTAVQSAAKLTESFLYSSNTKPSSDAAITKTDSSSSAPVPSPMPSLSNSRK